MLQLNTPQKLTSSALIYLLLKSTITTIIIVILVAGLYLSLSLFQNYKQLILLAVVVLPVLILTYTVFWWKLFRYTIGNDSVNIKSGVIIRTEKNVDFNKVQSINAVFGPLLAMLGLKEVRGFTSSPEQLVITSSKEGGTRTQHIPDIKIILLKDDADEFLQVAKKGNIQKVQTISE